MWIWTLALVYLLTTSPSSCRRVFEKSEVLTSSSSPADLTSINYPRPSPPNSQQIWNYKFDEEPGVEQAIFIACNVYMTKDPATKQCPDKLTVTDGRYSFPICGKGPISYTSFTNELKVSLITTNSGSSAVSCLLTVKPVKRPDYLKLESEEVDSSEYGGEEGEKATTCACGWANKVKSRIVNGTVTAENEFPFMATLIRKPGALLCGATIITNRHVLTAAHCTYRRTAKDLGIVIGAHDRVKGKGFLIQIAKISDHDDFDRFDKKNDISLLTLAKEIEFNQFIGPACLPQKSPQLQLDRQYVTSIGFGSQASGAQNASRFLMKVNTRVITMEECHQIIPKVAVKNPTQICDYATAKSSCQGDSGGPVVWVDPETNRYTLVGVTSFGRSCADYYPSVETRVQAFLSWIKTEISNSGQPDSTTCTKV